MKQSEARGGLLLCIIGIRFLIDCVRHLFFRVTETKRNFDFDCATCILYHNFSPNYFEFCCHGVDYPYTINFLAAKSILHRMFDNPHTVLCKIMNVLK